MINAAAFEVALFFAGCGLTAVVILLRASWPSLAARADAAAEARSGGRRFLLGLLNGPALFLLATALGGKPEYKPLSLVVLAVLCALAVWGLSADLRRLGRRILAPGLRNPGERDPREALPPWDTVAGGAALTGALLLPFVGWAVSAGVLLLAVGTGVSALFTRRRP